MSGHSQEGTDAYSVLEQHWIIAWYLNLLESTLQLEKSHEIGSENKMSSSAFLSGFEYVFSKYFADLCAC